jgi:DNA recombination protein RmuC
MLYRRMNHFFELQKSDSSIMMLNQNIQGMQDRIDKNTHALDRRLDQAAQVIGSVQKELGGMTEIGRQIKDFQEFLRSPKLRGNIGEQILKDLLEQMIPKANFRMQYTFKTGDRVDAIIKTKNGLIPIDSKFPMENYQKYTKVKDQSQKKELIKQFFKDTKKHIDVIAKKYILPSEGTVDFALMYLPSEAIYYEVINNVDLYHYAGQKKVFFVSPNSFYYFLKIIIQALENEKIEEKAHDILKSLRSIQNDSNRLGTDLNILGKHVNNAKNSMDVVQGSYMKLGSKIENTGKLQANQVKEIEEKLPEIKEEIEVKN